MARGVPSDVSLRHRRRQKTGTGPQASNIRTPAQKVERAHVAGEWKARGAVCRVLAASRAKGAPHMHIPGCICSNVRQVLQLQHHATTQFLCTAFHSPLSLLGLVLSAKISSLNSTTMPCSIPSGTYTRLPLIQPGLLGHPEARRGGEGQE